MTKRSIPQQTIAKDKRPGVLQWLFWWLVICAAMPLLALGTNHHGFAISAIRIIFGFSAAIGGIIISIFGFGVMLEKLFGDGDEFVMVSAYFFSVVVGMPLVLSFGWKLARLIDPRF